MYYTCNNMQCRTILSSGHSWVTFCSHIFCDVCGTDMSHSYVCLACEVSLYPTGMSGVLKLRRINIEPSNEEKMVSLAGLSPRNIMEMCMAGLSFHQHQMKQEINVIHEKMKRMKDREEKLKDYYEQVILQYKVKLSKVEIELEEVKRFNMDKNQEVMSSSILATGESTSCQAYRSQQEAVQTNLCPSSEQSSNYLEYSAVPQETGFSTSSYNKDKETVPVRDSSTSARDTYNRLYGVLCQYSGVTSHKPQTSTMWK